MAKHLHKGDEDQRRFKIMKASRRRDEGLLPQLLARLNGAESYENRRHIVRALGNIGDRRAEDQLLGLLRTEQGLILGDVAHALGRLASGRARSLLQGLREHESEWVRQNASYALRRLATRGRGA